MEKLPDYSFDPELLKLIIQQSGPAAASSTALMSGEQLSDIGKKWMSAAMKTGKHIDEVEKRKILLEAQQAELDKIERAKDIQAFNVAAQDAVDKTPGLTSDGYSMVTDQLFDWKDEFIEADKKSRAIILNNVNNLATEVANTSSFATSTLPNLSGEVVDDFKDSDEGRDVGGIMGGTTPLIQRDNKLGWMIHEDGAFEDATSRYLELDNETRQLKLDYENGRISEEERNVETLRIREEVEEIEDVIQSGGKVFMTDDDVERLVKYNSFDQSSKDVLNAAVLNQIDISKKILPGQNGNFDYDSQSKIIKAQIVDKGNKRSLIYDKHLDVSFEEGIIAALESTSYKDLGIVLEKEFGIDKETVEILDPNTDNLPETISYDDALVIAAALIDDKEMVDHYLTTFFTNFLEQNWNDAAKERKHSTDIDINEFA